MRRRPPAPTTHDVVERQGWLEHEHARVLRSTPHEVLLVTPTASSEAITLAHERLTRHLVSVLARGVGRGVHALRAADLLAEYDAALEQLRARP